VEFDSDRVPPPVFVRSPAPLMAPARSSESPLATASEWVPLGNTMFTGLPEVPTIITDLLFAGPPKSPVTPSLSVSVIALALLDRKVRFALPL